MAARITSFLSGVCAGSFGVALHTYNQKHREQRKRFTEYIDLMKQHQSVLGPLGNAGKGEIEITLNIDEMREIEKSTGQKVGILAKNRFSTCLYDPVKFPSGSFGFHGRFFGTPGLDGPPGAAVLPVLPDGRILLICIYRHALRQWVLEIPRGARDGQESVKSLIEREVKEETGAEVGDCTLLGFVNPDSGMTMGRIPVMKVLVSKMGEANRDSWGESGMTCHAFTKNELDSAIKRGYAEINRGGVIEKVEFADSFLISALYLNQLHASE